MNDTDLIDGAARYVSHYMNAHKGKKLAYHNLDHTKSVVSSAIQIANQYQVADKDLAALIISAWFHDVGYYSGVPAGHEERSANLASEFLQSSGADPQFEPTVRRLIMATKMPHNPTDLLEQIICDADLFHLGTDEFSTNNKLLHKEVETTCNKDISKDDWRRETIRLLEHHRFHTDYARALMDFKKLENIDRLKAKLAQNGKPVEQPQPAVVKDAAGKKDKPSIPARGIETMFRITSGNNQRLSDMADNKAHILITVNSIILSAIISLLLRKLEESSFLTYPTFCLLVVSVLTIVVAIIATRPSIPRGVFTQKDIDDKRVNLLFFGNFYRMSLDDYSSGMREVMKDSDFLYGSLIKDVYAQGVVLGRKYRLLRISYNIFMFGLIISVLGFVLVFVFNRE